MYRIACLIMLVVVLIAGVPAMPAAAAEKIDADKAYCERPLSPLIPLPGQYGTVYDSEGIGSNYCAWLPPGTMVHDMVIFAHGYVDPLETNGAIPWSQLTLTSPSLPEILLRMNYGFAITSYSKNGLAVQEGVTAVWDLANKFKNNPLVGRIFLVGASEGGLVTTLAIEKKSEPGKVNPFSGGVTTCGPVGDFRSQVNYWGDFRVAFDYFFKVFRPALGNPVWISKATRDNWKELDPTKPPTTLQANIIGALTTYPDATKALLSVGKAPIDPADPSTIPLTVLGILDYNVRATNEARMELSGNFALDGSTNDGNPFGNKDRLYWGSGSFSSDWKMNQWIKANDLFTVDPKAIEVIQSTYQTTGKIQAPLVALHTTGDPIVPYWHESLYQLKIWRNGNGSKFFNIPVARYGHCMFTAQEAIFAFAVMVFKATGALPPLSKAPQSELDVLTQQDYINMLKQYEPKMIFIPLVSQ
jgi:hypothetical protein